MSDEALYRPGDPPPHGYMAWHAWAMVQHKAGLQQHQCLGCARWYFPQELDGQVRCGECADRERGER